MPRKSKPADPPAPRFHYVVEIVFAVAGDDGRRAAVADLASAASTAAEAVEVGDSITLEAAGALAAVDLSGTAPELRAHRLRHLADALVAQRARPTFPDSITLRWSKA